MSSTSTTIKNRYICIVVRKENNIGYWEIDTERNVANFRDWRTIPIIQKPPDIFIDVCETIEEFFQKIWQMDSSHYKMIFPDRKYTYNFNEPICSWSQIGVDAHDHSTVKYCEQVAIISTSDGQYLCQQHYKKPHLEMNKFKNINQQKKNKNNSGRRIP